MSSKSIIFIFLLIPILGLSQNDTLNQRDKNDLKQGHWIYYGKDRPAEGFPANGKIEEGRYVNDRKEGVWIRYHVDGMTPKLKGMYVNNRPCGEFWKYNLDGTLKESGVFVSRNDYYLKRTPALTAHGNPTDSLRENRSIPNIYPIPRCDDSLHHSGNIRGCVTGSGFNDNGHNKVFNRDDEIWQDGEFKDGRLWDGKLYIYDSDGILLKIKVYKAGEYVLDAYL